MKTRTLQIYMNDFSYTHGVKMFQNEDISGRTMTVLQFPECASHTPKEYYLMFMERLVKNLRRQYSWDVESLYDGKINTVEEYTQWLTRMNESVCSALLYNLEIPGPEHWEVYKVSTQHDTEIEK